jgi:hypothetical protein
MTGRSLMIWAAPATDTGRTSGTEEGARAKAWKSRNPVAANRDPLRGGSRQTCAPVADTAESWSARSPPAGPAPAWTSAWRALRDLFQGAHHCLLRLGVGDGARHPGAGFVAQPVQPGGQEPGPPLPHGGPADAQPRRDRDVAAALGAGQHDPARSASPCAVLRRVAHPCRIRRSGPDNTSGSSLVSPMPPADRGPRATSPPSRDLRRNATHVVTRETRPGH